MKRLLRPAALLGLLAVIAGWTRAGGGIPAPPAPHGPIVCNSRVLLSGDSITRGVTNPPLVDNSTYRWSAPLEAWMTARCVAAGKTPPTYLNTAITGQQTQSWYADLNAQVISQNADYVFLLIGTNDIGFGRPLEETRDKVHQGIVDSVAAKPSQKWFVLSLLLVEEKWPKGSNVSDGGFDARNGAILAGLTGLGSVAQWIYIRDLLFDWEAQFNVAKDATGWLTQDGVHLTKQGTGLGPISGAEKVSLIVESQISLQLN